MVLCRDCSRTSCFDRPGGDKDIACAIFKGKEEKKPKFEVGQKVKVVSCDYFNGMTGKITRNVDDDIFHMSGTSPKTGQELDNWVFYGNQLECDHQWEQVRGGPGPKCRQCGLIDTSV